MPKFEKSGEKDNGPVSNFNGKDDEEIGFALSFLFLTGAVQSLRCLLDSKRLLRFLREEEDLSEAPEPPSQLLEGYKLTMGVALFNILKEIVDCPQIIGTQPTDDYSMMFHWRDEPFPLPRGPTAYEATIRNLWLLRKEVLSSKDWADLEKASALIEPITSAFESIIHQCYRAEMDEPKKVFEIVELEDSILRDHLVIFLHDRANLSYARTEVYRSGSSERRKGLKRKRTDRGKKASDWERSLLKGYITAICFLWWLCLGSANYGTHKKLFEKLSHSSSWEDFFSLFGEVNDFVDTKVGDHDLARTVLRKMRFVQIRSIPPMLRTPICTPIESLKIPEESFKEMFELRPVRAVGTHHPYLGVSYFKYLFLGLLAEARHTGGTVKVLRFRHPDEAGNYYSYALFVPAMGTIATNASEYWIVLSVATDFSGYGGQARAFIEEMIKEGGDAVVVIEKEVEDIEALHRFLEPHQFKFLREQFNQYADLVSALRGSLGELLIAELLRREGYEILGIRKELGALGGQEVDVVAFRDSKKPMLLLVESKANLKANPVSSWSTGEIVDWETNKDMDDVMKFLGAISGAMDDKHSLLSELGVSLDSKVDPAIAVSGQMTRHVPDLVATVADAQVWSWENLAKRFRRAGLSKGIWEPLGWLSDAEVAIFSRSRFEADYLKFFDVERNEP